MCIADEVIVDVVESEQPALESDAPPLPVDLYPAPELCAVAAPWLDAWADYCALLTPPTPRLFTEAGALALASIAVARRLCLMMPWGAIWPNLYLLAIARSTLFGKSTNMSLTRERAERAFPHLIGPAESTPEALFSDLSGREPSNLSDLSPNAQAIWRTGRAFSAQRILFIDEASALLASAGKDYNAGLIEALCLLYDGAPYSRSTRGQGLISLPHPYITIFGASTPRAMAPHLESERLWANGFLARYGLLTPDTERPAYVEAQDAAEPVGFVTGLQQLHNRLPAPMYPDPPKVRSVSLSDGARSVFDGYTRLCRNEWLTADLDDRLWALYGRLPAQFLKVGILLAAMDWPIHRETPRIELQHAHRALSIAEAWRRSAHRAVQRVQASTFDQRLRRLLKILAHSAERGATARDVRQHMRDLSGQELDDLLLQAERLGEVERLTQEPGPKGGRPTYRYRVSRC